MGNSKRSAVMLSVDPLVRISALAAVQKTSGSLSDETFARFKSFAGDATQPTASSASGSVDRGVESEQRRLRKLAPLTVSASPLQLRELVRCFARSKRPGTIELFFESLGHAKSFLSLAPNELSDAIKKYPPEMLPRGNELLGRLKQHEADKVARSGFIVDTAVHVAMQNVVDACSFSEKAKCSTCHRIGRRR